MAMPTDKTFDTNPDWDKTDSVSLKDVPNFGPVTLAEFESMGIDTLDQIDALRAEGTARRWVKCFPNRLNANALIGIVTALDGVVWTCATDDHREIARHLVDKLRAEKGLPPSNRSQTKKPGLSFELLAPAKRKKRS